MSHFAANLFAAIVLFVLIVASVVSGAVEWVVNWFKGRR